MSTLPRMLTILTLTACALPALAAGAVEVSYDKPEQFSDAGRGAFDRERTMKSLTGFLQTLAARLPDGQTLRLQVNDIDLAGQLEPVGWNELRVLRGRADWPRVQLHYTLEEAGRTVKSGDALVADAGYLYGAPGTDMHQGDLGYEKRMLRQWFNQTFVSP